MLCIVSICRCFPRPFSLTLLNIGVVEAQGLGDEEKASSEDESGGDSDGGLETKESERRKKKKAGASGADADNNSDSEEEEKMKTKVNDFLPVAKLAPGVVEDDGAGDRSLSFLLIYFPMESAH